MQGAPPVLPSVQPGRSKVRAVSQQSSAGDGHGSSQLPSLLRRSSSNASLGGQSNSQRTPLSRQASDLSRSAQGVRRKSSLADAVQQGRRRRSTTGTHSKQREADDTMLSAEQLAIGQQRTSQTGQVNDDPTGSAEVKTPGVGLLRSLSSFMSSKALPNSPGPHKQQKERKAKYGSSKAKITPREDEIAIEDSDDGAESSQSDGTDDELAMTAAEREELQQERSRKRREAGLQILFVLLLSLLLWLPVVHQREAWQSAGTLKSMIIKAKFQPSTGAQVTFGAAQQLLQLPWDGTFAGISHVTHVWDFLEQILARVIFGTSVPGGVDGAVSGTGIVVNDIRLRQVRVTSKACSDATDVQTPLGSTLGECFPAFDSSLEDKQSFGPQEAFTYSEPSGLAFDYEGRLATYPEGGYVIDIPITDNVSSLLQPVQSARSLDFLDVRSRAVFIDILVKSPVSEVVFTVVRIVFEFSHTGGVFPTLEVEPLLVQRYSSKQADAQGMLTLEAATMIFVLGNALRLMYKIAKEKKAFFYSGANYVESIATLTLTVSLSARLNAVLVGSRLNLVSKDGAFVNAFPLVNLQNTERAFGAVALLVVYGVAGVKFVSFDTSLGKRFRAVLSKSKLDVVGAIIFAFISLLSFAASFSYTFGWTNEVFARLSGALLFQIGIVTGWSYSGGGTDASMHRFSSTKLPFLVFLVCCLIACFWLFFVALVVAAQSNALAAVDREQRHKPGRQYRRRLRQKILRIQAQTDVGAERTDDFVSFLDAMIEELATKADDAASIGPKQISRILLEFSDVVQHVGLFTVEDVMTAFDLEGTGKLTVTELRRLQLYLMRARLQLDPDVHTLQDRAMKFKLSDMPRLPNSLTPSYGSAFPLANGSMAGQGDMSLRVSTAGKSSQHGVEANEARDRRGSLTSASLSSHSRGANSHGITESGELMDSGVPQQGAYGPHDTALRVQRDLYDVKLQLNQLWAQNRLVTEKLEALDSMQETLSQIRLLAQSPSADTKTAHEGVNATGPQSIPSTVHQAQMSAALMKITESLDALTELMVSQGAE